MLKNRDKIDYIFNKNYAQGYRVDDTHAYAHTHIYIYIYIERLTEIYFVCNILRPYNYKAISKIKNDNRASNERYN